MRPNRSGDTLVTIVGSLTVEGAEDMQAVLELMHEEQDE